MQRSAPEVGWRNLGARRHHTVQLVAKLRSMAVVDPLSARHSKAQPQYA
jgi:hypothetical protein